MSEIQQYSCRGLGAWMMRCTNGGFVTYADHEEIAAKLRAERDNYYTIMQEKLSELIRYDCEILNESNREVIAEVERLRAELDRIRRLLQKSDNLINGHRAMAREALKYRNDGVYPKETLTKIDRDWMEDGVWCECNAYRTLEIIAGEGE